MLLNIALIFLVLVVVLLVVILARTLLYGRVPSPVSAVDLPEVDPQPIAERLSKVLQIPTVSGPQADEKFRQLHQIIEEMFPRVFPL